MHSHNFIALSENKMYMCMWKYTCTIEWEWAHLGLQSARIFRHVYPASVSPSTMWQADVKLAYFKFSELPPTIPVSQLTIPACECCQCLLNCGPYGYLHITMATMYIHYYINVVHSQHDCVSSGVAPACPKCLALHCNSVRYCVWAA
jgi:hypothetical protein